MPLYLMIKIYTKRWDGYYLSPKIYILRYIVEKYTQVFST